MAYTITIRTAASVKMCSAQAVRRACDLGVLKTPPPISGLPSCRLVWDALFEKWIPKTEPAQVIYHTNRTRTHTRTTRILPLKEALRTGRTTARALGLGPNWSVVPLNLENLELSLHQQHGSLDGNVFCDYLYEETYDALAQGRTAYQIRLHTKMRHYTQRLHPTPPLATAATVAARHGTTVGAVTTAIADQALYAAHYMGTYFVVLGAKYRAWAEKREGSAGQLFTEGLLAA